MSGAKLGGRLGYPLVVSKEDNLALWTEFNPTFEWRCAG